MADTETGELIIYVGTQEKIDEARQQGQIGNDDFAVVTDAPDYALASSLVTETTNRENADINLQQQIDAITASSDVTDIVGTYAELQAYDTSTLPPNSIIKVLQDESQNDETTYYRWVITGGVGAWVLIGEEGPYYTKSEADTKFVPQTRTINNKELSSNISLDASDVGAVSNVTVNGTSVVTDGVAVIPNASGSVEGVVKLSANLTSISDTIAATASMGNNLAKNIITGVNTYSASSTYSVGDKVRYGQYYYECITAITTAHAWNASEWQQITIQGQLDEKVSDVTVDGTSIVNGTTKVAVIPLAENSGDYGLVKLSSGYGLTKQGTLGFLYITKATDAEVIAKTNNYKPVVPANLDYAVKVGVTTNTNTLSAQEKSDACDWLGAVKDATINNTSIVTNGVAEIPIAAQNGDYGLLKLRSSAYGLGVDSSGYTIINRATTDDIDAKTAYYKPITPINLDYATKRGIAYNSLTLTDAEKASACSLVGALPNNIYGTSTTAAATVQKEVSIPSITSLNAGQLIIVKPTVTSTVANSTLKLNDFPAYPMLYGGNAITTSTGSYVWIANVPGWWLFDGSNWLFAGHGYDINTTYSAMTVANIIKGTETSGRLMRSDYLKDGICGVVTAYASGDTITPADKYLYNSTSDISTLTVNAPTSPDVRYVSQINFSSGTTATTLSYPNTFKVIEGCDDVQTVGGVKVFVPVANKRYQMFILNDGINNLIIAKGA